MAYAIKAHFPDVAAETFDLPRQKTMYGGRMIGKGDVVFLFDSENEGGRGLFARAVVTAASNVPRLENVARQTPRVNVSIRRESSAKSPLGRTELKTFRDWQDGLPQTELNFKLYRQATNKIVGLSADAAAFLERHF